MAMETVLILFWEQLLLDVFWPDGPCSSLQRILSNTQDQAMFVEARFSENFLAKRRRGHFQM